MARLKDAELLNKGGVMIKQERYAQKMIREGFVTVRSWVPAEKEDELKRITKAWREEKKRLNNENTES